MEFGPLVLPYGNSPQAAGSAITYARRYALVAALGLATEDDDGAAATQAARADRPRTQERRDRPAGASGAQRAPSASQGRGGQNQPDPPYVTALSNAIGKGVGYVLTVARKVAEGKGLEAPKSTRGITEELAVLTAERLGVAARDIGLQGDTEDVERMLADAGMIADREPPEEPF